MKRLIFLAAAAVLMVGCGTSLFLTASDIAGRTRIGMSVDEFKKLAGPHAELDAMTVDHTIYRIDQWSGTTEDRYVSGAKLFHFDSNQKLIRVETRDFRSPFFHDRHRPVFEPLNP